MALENLKGYISLRLWRSLKDAISQEAVPTIDNGPDAIAKQIEMYEHEIEDIMSQTSGSYIQLKQAFSEAAEHHNDSDMRALAAAIVCRIDSLQIKK